MSAVTAKDDRRTETLRQWVQRRMTDQSRPHGIHTAVQHSAVSIGRQMADRQSPGRSGTGLVRSPVRGQSVIGTVTWSSARLRPARPTARRADQPLPDPQLSRRKTGIVTRKTGEERNYIRLQSTVRRRFIPPGYRIPTINYEIYLPVSREEQVKKQKLKKQSE